MIALFDSACPAGWSRYAGLDGRVPRGEPTGDSTSLDQGGSDDAVVVGHDHGLSGSASSAGTHQHNVAGSSGDPSADHTHGVSFDTQGEGAHGTIL